MDDWSAGTLLRDLVAVEPPPSRVDGRRAISNAKRRRRRRRVGALATGVIVVAVGVLASVLPLAGGTPTPVADAPKTWNSKPANRFDPTRFTLGLDWQPDGITRVEQESDGSYQRLTLLATAPPERGPVFGGFVPIASIETYGTGGIMPAQDPGFRNTEPVYPGGAPGHWRAKTDQMDHAGALWWFWGPNAWAIVTVYDAKQPRELALRLARALKTDQDAVLTVPFSVPTPAGTRHNRTTTASGPGGSYGAEVQFAPIDPGKYDGWVGVSATNDRVLVTGNLVYVPVATRVEDLWDRRRKNYAAAATARVRTPGQDLVAVQPVVESEGGKALLDAAAARRVASSVQLVKSPGDKRNWTTKFLR